MKTKKRIILFGLLLAIAGCSDGVGKQTAPFVPRDIVQYPEESVYSSRITRVLNEQYEITSALLRPQFPKVRSTTEVALSDADIRVAMAWYQDYFSREKWQRMNFQESAATDQLVGWTKDGKLFAVRIIKPAADFDQRFLQYYIAGLENPS
jgi:hypothetical protein